MKLTKKDKLMLFGKGMSLTGLAILIVISIVICSIISLGWFANNRVVSGSNTDVHLECADAEAEYTVYIYDAKLETTRFSGDGGSDEPYLDNLKMPVHDVIFKQRNRYTPAIVHIHLSQVVSNYQNGGNLNLTIARDSSPAYETDNGKVLLPEKSTSIMRFTLANNHELNSSYVNKWLSSNPSPSAAANELYSNIDAALYQKVVINSDYTDTAAVSLNSAVFTTVTADAHDTITSVSKQNEITLTVSFSANDIVNGEMDLFLYMTYDEDLIGYFEHAEGLDTNETTVGKVTTLTNDLTELSISFSSN